MKRTKVALAETSQEKEYQKTIERMTVGGLIGFFIVPIIWISYLHHTDFFNNNNDPTIFDYWSNSEWIFYIFLFGGCVGCVLGSLLSLFRKQVEK